MAEWRSGSGRVAEWQGLVTSSAPYPSVRFPPLLLHRLYSKYIIRLFVLGHLRNTSLPALRVQLSVNYGFYNHASASPITLV